MSALDQILTIPIVKCEHRTLCAEAAAELATLRAIGRYAIVPNGNLWDIVDITTGLRSGPSYPLEEAGRLVKQVTA